MKTKTSTFKTVSFKCKRNNYARILIVQPEFSVKQNQETDLYEANFTKANKTFLNSILNLSNQNSVDLVVFPEFSIPESYHNTMLEWTKNNNTIVIGGTYYKKDSQYFYNTAPIFFQGVQYYTQKSHLSPKEINSIGENVLKNGIHRNCFTQTPIGKLGVIVCADIANIDIRNQCLRSKFDILCVISFQGNCKEHHTHINSMMGDMKHSGGYIIYSNVYNPENQANGGSSLFSHSYKNDREEYIKKGYIEDSDHLYKLFEIKKEAGCILVDCNIKDKLVIAGNTNPQRALTTQVQLFEYHNDKLLPVDNMKNTKKGNVDRKPRINSLKLYYERKYLKNMTTEDLSKSTKISEEKIIQLESFRNSDDSFNKYCFPECTHKEKNAIERVLKYSRDFLKVEGKDTDFMGYLLSYYYNQKMGRDFNRIKAVVFDFDGTLTKSHGKSTWERIWTKLGYTTTDCQNLYQRYANKEFDHQEWCNITCSKFKEKCLTKNIIKEIASDINLIEGCINTLKLIKNKDIPVFITSGAIKDIIYEVIGAENIDLFDQIKSNEIVYDKNGVIKRINGTKFDFEGKARFINEIVEQYAIKPYEILFIGNSHNDQFVYRSGAVTLCVNPHFANINDKKVWNNLIFEMKNLRQILPYLGINE